VLRHPVTPSVVSEVFVDARVAVIVEEVAALERGYLSAAHRTPVRAGDDSEAGSSAVALAAVGRNDVVNLPAAVIVEAVARLGRRDPRSARTEAAVGAADLCAQTDAGVALRPTALRQAQRLGRTVAGLPLWQTLPGAALERGAGVQRGAGAEAAVAPADALSAQAQAEIRARRAALGVLQALLAQQRLRHSACGACVGQLLALECDRAAGVTAL